MMYQLGNFAYDTLKFIGKTNIIFSLSLLAIALMVWIVNDSKLKSTVELRQHREELIKTHAMLLPSVIICVIIGLTFLNI